MKYTITNNKVKKMKTDTIQPQTYNDEIIIQVIKSRQRLTRDILTPQFFFNLSDYNEETEILSPSKGNILINLDDLRYAFNKFYRTQDKRPKRKGELLKRYYRIEDRDDHDNDTLISFLEDNDKRNMEHDFYFDPDTDTFYFDHPKGKNKKFRVEKYTEINAKDCPNVLTLFTIIAV